MTQHARQSSHQPALPERLAQQHARNFVDSLGRLYHRPVASLLTICVIGITLALPAGLHVLMNNLHGVSYSWESAIQASLFLDNSASEADGRALAAKIGKRGDVTSTGYISRAQSLAEFKQLSGFGHAVDALDHNPLPAVITVQPKKSMTTQAIAHLVHQLGELPQVQRAKIDQAWLQRLYAILAIVKRGMAIIAVLLACAVVFIVGNTIRLDIENRRNEIEVLKLLGASNGFIRRPFLYSGFWYGLAGGVLAWILLSICMLALTGPVDRLATLYNGQIAMTWLSFRGGLVVIGAGIALGWLGSAWTTSRRLHAIEPK